MFRSRALYRSYTDKGDILNLNTGRSYVFDGTGAFIPRATGEGKPLSRVP